MTVARDAKLDSWIVYDHAFSPPQPIITKPCAGLRDLAVIPDLCTRLRDAAFEGDGAMTIIERNEARNEAIRAESDKKIQAFTVEAADRLRFALNRALS